MPNLLFSTKDLDAQSIAKQRNCGILVDRTFLNQTFLRNYTHSQPLKSLITTLNRKRSDCPPSIQFFLKKSEQRNIIIRVFSIPVGAS